MHRMKLVIVFLLTGSALAAAQHMPTPINSGDIKWGPAPNVLPPGVQMAVVSGDPSKDALYVVRLKMPANYEIPAHNHPTTEHVTVLSGEFNVGMGDKLDRKKGLALQAGWFCRGISNDEPLCLDVQRNRGSDPRPRAIRDHVRESRRRPKQEIVRLKNPYRACGSRPRCGLRRAASSRLQV